MTLWYLALMAVTVLPILMGIGAFAFNYMKDEFYKHPFYDDQDA